jgi:hypothetical protein
MGKAAAATKSPPRKPAKPQAAKLPAPRAKAKASITAKPAAQPKPAIRPVKAEPPPTVTHAAEDVDPLLEESVEPLTLVGGLARDAQLPTSLVPRANLPATVPLTVHAQAVPGGAQHGNTQPANILVLVTCGGWPVVDLTEDHFSIMEHFDVPQPSSPFSNNVTSFRNSGSGAYQLQVRPMCQSPWHSGQHLGQVVVSSPDERHGQTAFKLIIR